MARAIVANARRTILVADHQKFERSAPVRICDLSQIDMFVTDRLPPARFRDACASNEVEVVVADGRGSLVAGDEHE